MAKTSMGLVSFVQAAADGGWGYVYGAFGQVCTEELLDRQAARFPDGNLAGGRMRATGAKWLGRRVCDCSGLIKAYMWMDGMNSDPQYNAQQDSMLANIYSNATEKGPMDTLPEIPGLALQLPGHVGVYIGNSEVIEAKGTEYGVVKSRLSDNRWQTWAKIPGIEYAAQPVPASAPAPSAAPAAKASAYGTVVGIDMDSCLNLWRSHDKSQGATEITYHNGDKLCLTDLTVPDWYEVDGGRGWVASVYVAVDESTISAPAEISRPSTEIQVGGKAKITGTQYANGVGIPQWVRKGAYTVSEISGDRVLLGHDGGINSWVKLTDLEAVN